MISEKYKYRFNNFFNLLFKEKFKKKLNFNWNNHSERFEIINKIINKKNFKKYLEIGCFKDDNFREINNKMDFSKGPVKSGYGTDMVFVIPFSAEVRVKCICLIGGDDGEAPTELKLYKNEENVDISIQEDKKPIDEIEAYISKLKIKVAELSIKDANIGTMMHTLCEDYILGKNPVAPTSEPLKTMFPKFTEWWDNMNIEVIETEKTYYSQELDTCGTVDLICKMNGKLGLIDFKTSKSIDYSNYPVQISAYRKMIMDSTDYKIEFLGLINIPKDKGLPINFRKIKVKNDYLKAFKLCKQLLEFENDYAKQLSDWKKLVNKQKQKKKQ